MCDFIPATTVAKFAELLQSFPATNRQPVTYVNLTKNCCFLVDLAEDELAAARKHFPPAVDGVPIARRTLVQELLHV